MSESTLRVLIVEDNPSDAKLLERELQRGGLTFNSLRVESEQQFIAALDIEPDVVLCDWNLPEFNSMAALKLLQQRWPYTPFILVSGSIGEEAAVNVMKLGAADYLLKDRLTRLVPAVQQGLAKRKAQVSALRVATALEVSERHLRVAQRAARLGSWEWDPSTGEAWWSDELYELLGVDRKSVEASIESLLDRIHPDDRPVAGQQYEAVLAGADGAADDIRVVTPDGRILWFHSRARANRDSDGQVIRVEATLQDITDRKIAEQSLRDREERLRFVIEGARLAMFDWDMVTSRVFWNDAHYRLFGYSPGDPDKIELHHFLDRIHPDDLPEVTQCLRAAVECGPMYTSEHRIVWPDGTVRWCSGYAMCRYDESGKAIRMLGVVQDITERKVAEISLAARESLYRLLADQMRDVVVLADADGKIRYISPSCEYLTGYTPTESQANGLWNVVVPQDLPVVRAAWARCLAGEVVTIEFRCRHRDGHELWVEALLTPVRGPDGSIEQVISTRRDITGRRVAEERLRQSQKLEAIGQLAGGVAHDFNNLLTVICGSSELVLSGLATEHPDRGLLEAVYDAGQRGSALTRQLLAFSRQQFIKPELFDLSSAVRDSCKMLTRLIGEDVRVTTEFAEQAVLIEADRGQVDQVLINLIVNARDAMPTGGRLSVRTCVVDVGAAHPMRPVSCPPGEYVQLSVADNGQGMSSEVLSRIFEPFFTTKPTGKGTGLGLATVHGIVGQARGFVGVTSELGSGTTIDVYFPRQQMHSDAELTRARPDMSTKGTELILLVEDEPAVRKLAVTVLRTKGFQVIEAESAADAIAAYEKCSVPPALLVTDVVMPGMSGMELARELTSRQPRLKVLYLSGYTSDAVLRHGIEQEQVEFLQKPFSLENLVRTVRAVLDKP